MPPVFPNFQAISRQEAGWMDAWAGLSIGRSYVIRRRFTIAEVNAGATILPALYGFKYRVNDMAMISIGGAAGAATLVRIVGTRTTAVALLGVAIAALTENTLVRAGASNATILAAGASYTQLDSNTAITIDKTGSALTTATHIDVIMSVSVDEG